nr:hypothetical protein [Tanacetum cinerariifolium]
SFRAKNDKVKQHYIESYDSIKITHAKHIKQVTKLTAENVTLKTSVSKAKVQPPVLTQTKHAVDVEPIVPHLRNNRDTHLAYLRHLKESVETIRDIVEEAKVVRPLDRSIVSACRYTKHSQELLDVYYVEGLSHNLYSVEQFCDSDLEVAFRKNSCYVQDTDGVDLIKGSHGSNLYTISVEDMMKSSPIYLLSKASKNKSWLWHRRLNHLNFGTINDLARKDLVRGLPRLKFKKDHLCSACQLEKSKKHTHKPKAKNTNLEVLNTLHMNLCGPIRVQTINGKKYILVIVDDYSRIRQSYYERIGIFHQKTVPKTPQQNEAMATACYTQNPSLIHTRHHKTPYELVHNKKPDLTFFRVVDALCYPTNDSEDLRKLQPTADTGIFVGYAPSRKGTRPAPNFLTPGQISSGLIPNPVPATPYAPPTNKELEILFQPMFDEYLEPPQAERLGSPAQAVQAPVTSAGTPLSTTIDQDAPSLHISPSSSAIQSYSLPPGVVAEPHFMEDHNIAPVDNNPFVNVFAPKPHSEASSSGDIRSTESPHVSQSLHHLNKWSKDHPLDNVIGNPS